MYPPLFRPIQQSIFPENLFYINLCQNQSPLVIAYMEQYITNVNWYTFSYNPYAVYLFLQNIRYINFDMLYLNPHPTAFKVLKSAIGKIRGKHNYTLLSLNPNPEAIQILRGIPKKEVDWLNLLKNPSPLALDFALENIDHILPHIKYLSANPLDSAVDWLFEHPEHIHLAYLCENSNPRAFQYLLDYIEMSYYTQNDMTAISWFKININSCDLAVDFLEKHPQHIQWDTLALNPSSRAIELYEKHQVPIPFHTLLKNGSPASEKILLENIDKLNIGYVGRHTPDRVMSGLLKLDYLAMHIQRETFNQELIEYVMHPKRMFRLSTFYGMDMVDYLECLFY